jgi:Ca2+-binding RTX toxin-like protein
MASAGGVVVRSSFHPEYGNVVIVDHGQIGDDGQRVYTLYAHLNSMSVQVGQHLEAGQLVGLSGSTGSSTGPHLHYEVIQAPNGDPLPWNQHGPTGVNPYQYRQDPYLWRGSEADPEIVPVSFHADPEYVVDLMEATGREDLDPEEAPEDEDAADESPIEVADEEFEVFQTSSPIILDLDGDGVETRALGSGTYFDHAGDGFREETGWVGSDDGLLVLDRNGNGEIDDGRELFGNLTPLASGVPAADGYEALAELDANEDGAVDARDPAWAQLRVWQDTDGDGVSSADELHGLSEVGVAAVATASAASTFVDPHGNEHRLVGAFTRADGTTGATADVWLQVDRLYSFAADSVEIPADVAGLPNARGYGTVYDLRQAMARDATGALTDLVQRFSSEADSGQRTALLEQILFSWTGSDSIDPSSRGAFIDARRLAVLERICGEAFIGIEGTGNPNEEVGGLLNGSYQTVAELVGAQLLAQTHVRDLWELVTYRWDPATRTVTGDLSPVAAELRSRLAVDAAAGMAALSEFARSVRGFGLEGFFDYESFRDAFAADGEDVAWAVDSGGKNLLTATPGDDVLTGDSTANAVRGGDGDDTLSGDEGDDVLYGQGGADSLVGGAADDLLDGGEGNDSLAGRRGNDRLFGQAGDDTLSGEAGADLLEGGDGDDSLDGGEGDDVLRGGSGADTLLGREQNDTLFGGDGDDTVTGNRGNDVLAGEAGSDALSGEGGEDVLDGGAGDDSLDGGTEGDTYRFGRGGGRDVIVDRDWAPGNRDVLALGAGIEPADLLVRRAGDDLVLQVVGTADQVRITAWFAEAAARQYEIEEVRFASGTVWDRELLRQLAIVPTDGPDSLTGYETADALQGLGGDDTLVGRGGDDHLDGGEGHDVLSGDEGNDTLLGGAGMDSLRGNEGHDTLHGGAGDDALAGDRDDDTLAGEDGNDTLDGGGGADILDGGSGHDILGGGSENDVLDGGEGDDALAGDDGDDTLRGGPGADALGGNAGRDTLYGGDGDDVLLGDRDDDVLAGEAGHDRLDGGFGSDAMAGGAGDDTYVVDALTDTVTEAPGEGMDTVETSVAFTLSANVERLVLTGTGAVDGTGNALDNALTGNVAANRLDGGAGADAMAGGAGDDTYVVDNPADTVTEVAGEGTDTVEASVTYALPANGERLVLAGSADLDGTGNELDNALTGNGGANRLQGGAGADTMVGGAGDDVYVVDNLADVVVELPGGGTDTVESSVSYALTEALESLRLIGPEALTGTGNALNNRLTGNGAANRLEGGAGDDVLDGGGGPDFMVGGAGDDTYVVADAGDAVTELAGEGTDTIESAVTLTLPTDVENLLLTGTVAVNGAGNAQDNRLTGNGAPNSLTGGAGDDVLDGGMGADILAGGTGNDTYVVSETGDVVTELANQGIDTVVTAVAYALPANVENLTLTGQAAADAAGNAAGNALTGNGGANRLNGGGGADVMAGGAGDDTYVVDNAGDTVVEADGEGLDAVESSVSHVLAAHVERLTLTGGGAINGTGNALDNALTGNGAANLLDGAAGADTMAGGAGDDTYTVDSPADVVIEGPGAGTDTVQSWASYALPDHVERLILMGTAALNGTGNGSSNTLTGNSGANVLDGGAGIDTMAGGAGDDVYVVDSLFDAVQEASNAGIDTVRSSATYALNANVENLTLIGSAAINGGGNSLGNVLQGNSASNLLDGRTGNDTYLFARGGGRDTIVDFDLALGNRDVLAFAGDLDPIDLIIGRASSNLRVAVQGSSDRVEIQNWYGGWANRVEVIKAADGRQLLSSQVDQLIQAMAVYSLQTGLTWEQAVAQRPEAVEAILAAYWQPAAG